MYLILRTRMVWMSYNTLRQIYLCTVVTSKVKHRVFVDIRVHVWFYVAEMNSEHGAHKTNDLLLASEIHWKLPYIFAHAITKKLLFYAKIVVITLLESTWKQKKFTHNLTCKQKNVLVIWAPELYQCAKLHQAVDTIKYCHSKAQNTFVL